jgi:hypothetical protein
VNPSDFARDGDGQGAGWRRLSRRAADDGNARHHPVGRGGPGGNITIVADNYFAELASVGTPSSFGVSGRGGVPIDPDGYLPIFAATGAPVAGVAPSLGLPLAVASRDCGREIPDGDRGVTSLVVD